MAVLGSGTSNGGCSLLHAAGLGYGLHWHLIYRSKSDY